jgi:regulator of RNase E activity RraB
MPNFLRRFRRGEDFHPGDRDLIKLMTDGGEQLATRPRETTHYLHFEDSGSASRAAEGARSAGFSVVIEGPEERDDWQVQARHVIIVDLSTITTARSVLTEVADTAGGCYDGWDTYADAALDEMAKG